MNTAEYLVRKLEELGVNDFFGLPGDYNFELLYAIENNPDTNWIGCTNELNAGYAADGYARERGFGAVVTTYGVGELSVMNAIAGSFAENVPVVHIVGTPSSKHLENKTLIHHNFQEPKPFAYAEAYKNILETVAFLSRDNAKLEINRVLKALVKERKPVYIAIPSDVAKMEISEREAHIDWQSDEETLNTVVARINEKIRNSKRPVILGDVLVKRFDSKIEFKELVEKTGIPTTNFLMGTDLIDTDLENYVGTYFSGLMNKPAEKLINNTDCLIAVGPIYSDLNAFGFNLPFKINSHVAIYGTYTYVDGIKFENVKMSDVLDKLSSVVTKHEYHLEKEDFYYSKTETPQGELSSEYIYPRLQEFLRENDVLFAETGIIPQGVARIKLPNNADLQTQTLWGSIGWATPAAFGAAVAKPNKRVILFTGEGSHQLTAMELGSMLRYGAKPIVLVLNNKGYTIERVLSNKSDDKFNDIVQMNYSRLARVFEGDVWSTQVKTQDDFDKALRVAQIMNKLCYIEICTDQMDIPELTLKMIKSLKDTDKSSIKESKNDEKVLGNKKDNKLSLKSALSINFATKVHESLKKDEEE